MESFLYSVFGFVVSIFVLVTVHELGHFSVARFFKVKVSKFSIGFGPSLAKWKHGDSMTEYQISIIPLGGFVRFLDEELDKVASADLKYTFRRQPLWIRLLIVLAGPAFNFLLAIFLMWCVFSFGVISGSAPFLSTPPTGTMAAKMGVVAGDQLYKIDNERVKTFEQKEMYLVAKALQVDSVSIEILATDGDIRQFMLTPEMEEVDLEQGTSILRKMGFRRALIDAKIGLVMDGSPAQEAGIQVGDKILHIAGKEITHWVDLVQEVIKRPKEEVEIVFQRNQGIHHALVTLSSVVSDSGDEFGRLGVAPEKQNHVRINYNFSEAFSASLSDNYDNAVSTLSLIKKMLTGSFSMKHISGPVRVAVIAGDSVQSTWQHFLSFLAVLSISIGVLNLLPIPFLDGGQFCYMIFEETFKQANQKIARVVWQGLGILLLGLLMFTVVYNDFIFLLSN